MSGLPGLIHEFINIMQGLVIGTALTLIFLIFCWMITKVCVGIMLQLRKLVLPADPKHVYPPYIKRNGDHESE